MSTRITEPGQLDLIHDKIHDCWFNVSDIKFNESESKLSIKFDGQETAQKIVGRKFMFKKVEYVSYESYLIIKHVIDYSVNDTERVESYDFNILNFNSSKGEITIETGVPIEIKATVKQFEIEIRETNHISRKQTSWTVFKQY